MNKDALLATLIGFGIGLLITGAFLFGPNIISTLPSLSFTLPNFSFGSSKPQVSPIPSPEARVTGLTVTVPVQEALVSDENLLVSGTAPAGSIIVIAGVQNETVATTSTDNTFAGKLTLIEGKNDVVVSSYIDQKEEISRVTVYYTPQEL